MIEEHTEKMKLMQSMAELLNGKRNDDVIPTLITASAHALALGCHGDENLLSTMLLKFCRLLEDTAADLAKEAYGSTQH